MPPITVETPAKINLVLDVVSRRADGFHEIRSLMVAVGLYDQITVEAAPAGIIEVECDDPGVPTDASNLVVQAAQRLGERLGGGLGCRMRLRKRIPVGGGLGGGSGNAAGTLRALNDLWQGGLNREELADVGATIGSDVPFFFYVPGAIVFGRGDCVQPVQMMWRGWAALVATGVPVRTGDVYACCKPGGSGDRDRDIAELMDAKSAATLRPHLRNGLEDAVFAVAPAVKRLRDALAELGARTMRVSGAGSVLFDLFDEETQAREFIGRARSCRLADMAVVVPAPARCGWGP